MRSQAAISPMMSSPARPPLAITVGVIGHRPNRIPDGARARIDADIAAVLAAIAAACRAARDRHAAVFAEIPARPVLLSALAEGADRYAALLAPGAGFDLSVALPFPVADYESDFADAASREEYRRLIAAAGRVLVLPGQRDATPGAYDTVGTVILDNADIILSVWDGGPSAGKGGTTDLLERAAAMGLPIVHVDARGVAPPAVLWSGLAAHPVAGLDLDHLASAPAADAIPEVVDRIVRPPDDAGERQRLARYLAERSQRYNWRLEVPVMLAMFGLRRIRRSDIEPAPPQAIAADLERVVTAGATPPATVAPALAAYAAAYGFADATAVRYAQIFRGSYVARFMLAAVAVIIGVVALVGGEIFGWTTWGLAVLQLAIVLVILLNTAVAARRNWHGRWRETRETAERMRAAVASWLLGQIRNDASGTEPAWTGWYARACLRALGLWSGELDAARLGTIRETLADLVENQRAYHAQSAELMHAIEQRLGSFGRLSFIITLGFVSLDIGLQIAGIDLPGGWNAVLIGLTAGLPVFGTASFGIRAIGDFEGTAMRSRRMAEALAGLGAALAADPAELVVLRARAAALADAMLGDVAHWRFATETRNLGTFG